MGILAFALVLALTGYTVYSRHSSPASAPAQATSSSIHASLGNVMQAQIHKEYTFLSFTIWHDPPLSAEKMDAIAAASTRIQEAADQELAGYAEDYRRQGWSSQDADFFQEKRLQLSRVATELSEVAHQHNAQQVASFFMHLDSTCQSCHKRFRPDLVWI
jgi:cytochrome c556